MWETKESGNEEKNKYGRALISKNKGSPAPGEREKRRNDV